MNNQKSRYGTVLEIQAYPDGSGIRVARRFLDSLLKEFASWNVDFQKSASLLPVTYGEWQISGGLFKAILQSGAQALTQPPIKRKRRGVPEKQGWADFVAYFKDTMLVLEVKHTWCKLNCFKKTEMGGLNYGWEDAVKQIKSLGQAVLSDWGEGWQTHFGAAMQLVVVYQRHKMKGQVQSVDKREVVNYIRSLSNRLTPKPNWIWLWSLNPKLQGAEEYNKKWENYPAVCFFIYLKRLD